MEEAQMKAFTAEKLREQLDQIIHQAVLQMHAMATAVRNTEAQLRDRDGFGTSKSRSACDLPFGRMLHEVEKRRNELRETVISLLSWERLLEIRTPMVLRAEEAYTAVGERERAATLRADTQALHGLLTAERRMAEQLQAFCRQAVGDFCIRAVALFDLEGDGKEARLSSLAVLCGEFVYLTLESARSIEREWAKTG